MNNADTNIMENPDFPAMPISYVEILSASGPQQTRDILDVFGGLTKREHFAAMAMQGLISSCDQAGEWTGHDCAREAVEAADALLKALETDQ
ncbi:MAG: hypothetical protein V3R67_08880 [Thermodesulfobacteriota bacterium]